MSDDDTKGNGDEETWNQKSRRFDGGRTKQKRQLQAWRNSVGASSWVRALSALHIRLGKGHRQFKSILLLLENVIPRFPPRLLYAVCPCCVVVRWMGVDCTRCGISFSPVARFTSSTTLAHQMFAALDAFTTQLTFAKR